MVGLGPTICEFFIISENDPDHRVQMLAQRKRSNVIHVENTAILEKKMCPKSVKPSIHEVKETVANDETYFCWSINCDDSSPAWKVDLDLNDVKGHPVTFKLDSGADVAVISDSNYKEPRLRPSLKTVKANLNSPGGPLNSRGQFIAKATVKGSVCHFRVIVVVIDVKNNLSRGLLHV